MSEDQRIARGHQASRELKETEAAFDQVEKALLGKLAATPITSPDVVLKLHAGLQALDGVRRALRMVIDDGLVAEHAIQAAGLTRPS
jgi:hypothetical protein